MNEIFQEYIRKLGDNEAILNNLKNDGRVKKLQGKMISRGSGASRFDTRMLSIWYLWAVDEFGKENADKYLSNFLNSDKISVVNTLWILGVETEKEIDLGDGFRITPVDKMPDSIEKRLYIDRHIPYPTQTLLKPKAAITKICEVKKEEDDDIEKTIAVNNEFWDSSKKMYCISLLLNIIDNMSCTPFYATSYTSKEVPLGIFGGSGGGSSIFDVMGNKIKKIARLDTKILIKLLSEYEKWDQPRKDRMNRILLRFSQAKRREQIEDKMLDLGISMEMALLNDHPEKEQLGLTFRLRGSWLLAQSSAERKEIYGKLKDMYNFRSQVAHSGVLCGNNLIKIKEVRDSFNEYASIGSKILQRLILTGEPEWENLILDYSKG